MTEGPIPSGELPLSARAPGKCILFGEHAVVHGRPELLLAIDLQTQVLAAPSPEMRLNGTTEGVRQNRYVARAMETLWPPGSEPIEWRTLSRIPRSAGLGSSAALSSALAATLLAARGGAERSVLAEASFSIERGAQGVGSPGDTSASVAGGLVALNGSDGPPLWEVSDAEHRWLVRRVEDPGWIWVVAYSGVPRNTAETVRAVGRRLAEPDGPRLLDRFEEVARAGIAAVLSEDRGEVGRRMDENHELLKTIGVSHPKLEAMLDAARPVADGAKLTGAGAGGSVLVLPSPGQEVECQRRLRAAGGQAFVVRAAPRGAGLVETPEEPAAPE
ncbi:MAG TPA: hypothetical protein VIZ68_05155 [Thermoplasmata archaeon]